MYDITVNGDGFNHTTLSFKSGMGELYHFKLTTDAQVELIRKLAQDLVFAQIDPFVKNANLGSLKRMIEIIELDME